MDVSLVERDDGGQLPPLAVTIKRACKVSGYGTTTIWALIRDGYLETVRVPGVRRTLISYASLAKLLTPSPTVRRRGPPPHPQRASRAEKVRSGRSGA
jgi:hypothetical protein